MDVKRHSVKTENAASNCQQYCGQHLWVHGYKLQYFVRRAKYNSRGFVKIYVTIHSPQSFSVLAGGLLTDCLWRTDFTTK